MPRRKNDDREHIEDDVMITERDFARLIGYSLESVRKMRARGYVDRNCTIKMPPYYRMVRGVRYKRSEANVWHEQFRRG